MTTRNKKTTAPDVDPKDASGAQADVLAETTEDEAVEDYPTFTVTIGGVEREIEDRWTKPGTPAGMAFVFHERYAQKYMPAVIEQIIGEDQNFMLIEEGATTAEYRELVQAWAARHAGK